MSRTDLELLKRYTEQRSEEAFAEIVQRHVHLVFSAALRQVRSAQLAEEVAQSVFIDLARQADRLAPNTILTAWLYQVTGRTAIDVVRRETRRQFREQVALEINSMNAAAADWTEIEPFLDEAMRALDETDRAAVLLRFFENKSLREVGLTLGTTEEAARKRVSRAVERLRELFAARGVAIGASGLAVVISANAVQAAPAGLGAGISTAAGLSGAMMAQSTAGTMKALAMTTLQKTLVTAVIVVGVGSGFYEAREAAHWRSEAGSLQQQQSPVTGQARQLQRERDEMAQALAALKQENETMRSNTMDLVALRGEVSRLRAQSREAAQAKPDAGADTLEPRMKSWVQRVAQLKQRLADHPEAGIPEFQFLGDFDWLAIAEGKLETEEDLRKAMSDLRHRAGNNFAPKLRDALEAYGKANNGGFPTDLSQLQPFFKKPVDDAVLQRWEIVPAEKMNGNNFGGDWLVTEKAPVDEQFDRRWGVGPNGYGTTGPDPWHPENSLAAAFKTLQPAVDAYSAANGGKEPSDPSILQPYLTTPEQKAALRKLSQAMQEKQGR